MTESINFETKIWLPQPLKEKLDQRVLELDIPMSSYLRHLIDQDQQNPIAEITHHEPVGEFNRNIHVRLSKEQELFFKGRIETLNTSYRSYLIQLMVNDFEQAKEERAQQKQTYPQTLIIDIGPNLKELLTRLINQNSHKGD